MAVMTIAVPYDWLPTVPVALVKNEDIPLFGYPPPFPWEQFAEVFAKIFQLESVNFIPSSGQIREANKLYEGLESHLLPLFFDFSPLIGTFCFVMSEQDVNRLMNLILLGSIDGVTLVEPEYQKGFYEFLALEISNIFVKLDYASGIVPHLIEQKALPAADSFCQDVRVEIQGIFFVGRIIVSNELRKSWKQRFAERSLTAKIPAGLGSKIQATVHLEAGRVVLQQSEWAGVSLGDCLLLDHCTLEGNGEKGRVIMTLDGRPLFRAKVKEGNLKILESSLFHEIDAHIAPPALQPKPEPQIHQEAKLADTFDEEYSSFEDEFSEFDDLESSPPVKPAAPKVPNTPSETPQAEKQSMVEPEDDLEADEEAAISKVAAENSTKPLAIHEIPLTVIVEVGRLQISIQKLMELEAGNLLELNIHPENGVNLVVNGAVIAKGELLKIGDSLGVRILDKA